MRTKGPRSKSKDSWKARSQWLGKSAAGQIAAGVLEEDQSLVQPLANAMTPTEAHCGAYLGPARLRRKVLLNAVEMSNLAQDPSALCSLLARL